MGFLFAFLSALFFTLNSMFLKKGMRASEKDNGVFMSIIVNVMVLGLAWPVYRLLTHDAGQPTFNGILFLVLAGVCTTFFGRSMLFAGIRRVGPSRAVALKNTAPVFSLLFAVLILNEAYGIWPWAGLMLIFAGLGLQGLQLFHRSESKIDRLGLLFAVMAAVGFGIGQGFRKQGIIHFDDPFAGAFIGAMVALVSFSISEMIRGDFIELVKSNLRFQNKFYVWSGLMTSMALLSFFISLQYIHVAYASAIAAVEPVLTVIFSKIFLKAEEEINPQVIAVSVFIFMGAGVIAFTG